VRRVALAVLIALVVAGPCAAQIAGPFPAIVLSHGSPSSPAERVGYRAKYAVASAVFVKWGFVVRSCARSVSWPTEMR
jgi:hypothetical protein